MAFTRREISARYRARHLEQERARMRAYRKKWHAAHRAESIAAMKANYAARREEIAAQRKAQRLLPNREAELAARRKRWDRQRDKRNAQRRLRRKADVKAARLRDAKRRTQPGYSEQAVARTAEWSRKHPEHARALRRKVDSKRRAIEQNVFVEAVDPRVVFERDKGMCGICQESVDPMSPWEVDHIIPIAKRGAHSYANVQLAHPRCNRKKAAK